MQLSFLLTVWQEKYSIYFLWFLLKQLKIKDSVLEPGFR